MFKRAIKGDTKCEIYNSGYVCEIIDQTIERSLGAKAVSVNEKLLISVTFSISIKKTTNICS